MRVAFSEPIPVEGQPGERFQQVGAETFCEMKRLYRRVSELG
jgi:hypothetical protein